MEQLKLPGSCTGKERDMRTAQDHRAFCHCVSASGEVIGEKGNGLKRILRALAQVFKDDPRRFWVMRVVIASGLSSSGGNRKGPPQPHLH